MSYKLPDNWMIEYDASHTYLYRWEPFTTGHLWWKKTRQRWEFRRTFRGKVEWHAIEYAIRTERQIRLYSGAHMEIPE